MKNLKIVTVIGTRPELIKMSLVIRQLDKFFDHKLIHTGQNHDYELNQIFFNELSIRPPDYYLDANLANFAESIGVLFAKCYDLFGDLKPDGLVIYGDTNSCLCAYVAKRMDIPVFHLEAGNRCFDSRVPEEINRKVIDHISDINLVISENARSNLLLEGLSPDRVMNIGSNMPEVLDEFAHLIDKRDVLERYKLIEEDYILLTLHREENVDDKHELERMINSIEELSHSVGKKIIWPVHPRTHRTMQSLSRSIAKDHIILTKPFGFLDFAKLQKHCYCLISDSGTISEEAALLGIPAFTMRFSTERPEGLERGSFSVAQVNDNLVTHSELARELVKHKSEKTIYPKSKCSLVVAKIIISYAKTLKVNTRTR